MLSTGVHFVNVNLVMPWNSLLLRTLRLHGIATFTSMLKSTFHSMTCLDPIDAYGTVILLIHEAGIPSDFKTPDVKLSQGLGGNLSNQSRSRYPPPPPSLKVGLGLRGESGALGPLKPRPTYRAVTAGLL